MKTNELIDKYFAGETSPAEELELRRLLSEQDSADDRKLESIIFDYFATQKEESLGEDFDRKVYEKIAKTSVSGKIVRFNWKVYILSTAAVVALITIGGLFFMSNNQLFHNDEQSGLVITDQNVSQHKQQATQTTSKALTLVSESLDKANEQIQKLGSAEKGREVLSKLDLLKKLFNKSNKNQGKKNEKV